MSVRSRLEFEAAMAKGEVVPGTPDPIVAPVVIPDQEREQDPSMPEVAPVAAVVPAALAAPVAPVAPVEQRYTWQPTDDQGHPIGGLQVIVYTTEQEKFEKMQEKTVLLLRELRKTRREQAIGAPEERIDGAEVFEKVVEFKPRDLTADERFKVSQGITSPDGFDEARDLLLESTFGVKPAILASALNEFTRDRIRAKALDNYVEFAQTTGFPDTPENRTLLAGWIGTRNLAPTVANFVIAQNRLKEAGLLQDAPVVQQVNVPTPAPVAAVVPVEESKPQIQVTPPPALASQEPQAKRQSHVPSGLNATIASPAGSIPVGGVSLTLADIEKMPADEYKKRIKDPAFFKLVNQLEADATARRRARANA